jgi:hypothetical protein
MNSESRELLRKNLLIQLEAVTPTALRTVTLKLGAAAGGFEVDDKTVVAELTYLAAKGLVQEAGKTISPENKHWLITMPGRDFVAENRLA